MDADDIYRLRRVVSFLSRRLNRSASLEGLSPSQASVLGVINSNGPLALTAVADVEGINPTMLSRVVGQLVARGLIRRTPDRDDLRSAWVEVLPAGRATHRKIKAHRDKLVTECIGRLPPESVASIRDALPALESLVEELHRHGANTYS